MTANVSDNCPPVTRNQVNCIGLGCDVEQCSICGHQLLGCEHFLVDAEKAPPDAGRMPWTGERPGTRECREFGWYVKQIPRGQAMSLAPPDDPGA